MDMAAAANVDDMLLGIKMALVGTLVGGLVAVVIHRSADVYEWTAALAGFGVASAVAAMLWLRDKNSQRVESKNKKIFVTPIQYDRNTHLWNPVTMKNKRIKIQVINKGDGAAGWRRGTVDEGKRSQNGKQLFFVIYDDGDSAWFNASKAKWSWDSSPNPNADNKVVHSALRQLH
jgi:hypothetical protein